jgi:hypothetical protein
LIKGNDSVKKIFVLIEESRKISKGFVTGEG